MTGKGRILLTSSRRPTDRMRTLCRDLSHTFPAIIRVNRGKMSLEEVAEKALEFDAEKIVVIDRWKHGFGKIEFFYVKQHGLEGVPPILCVCNVKFRRDFGETKYKGKRIRSIAFVATNKREAIAEKLVEFLSSFFNVPLVSFGEIENCACDAVAQILPVTSMSLTLTFKLLPDLIEVGPRIEISHVVWEFRR